MDEQAKHTGDPEFGARLRTLREAAGLTQAQAAYKLTQAQRAQGIDKDDTDTGTWSRWERGVAYPRASQVMALSRLFGVSTDHLLFGDAEVPFVETTDWADFLESPYGKLAKENGWLENLKRIRLPVPMTAQVYQTLVHAMLSVRP